MNTTTQPGDGPRTDLVRHVPPIYGTTERETENVRVWVEQGARDLVLAAASWDPGIGCWRVEWDAGYVAEVANLRAVDHGEGRAPSVVRADHVEHVVRWVKGPMTWPDGPGPSRVLWSLVCQVIAEAQREADASVARAERLTRALAG